MITRIASSLSQGNLNFRHHIQIQILYVGEDMAEQQAVNAPPLLLPEALGFSPQLLLDDIINIANNAVTDAVNGLEEFLQRWADERAKKEGGSDATKESEWDPTGEVEQGLVAFQTLLEYHTDIAFDFFEAWSLRNVFAVPPDLPIVLPHQEGLDLTQSPEREKELMDEIVELRLQLQDVRPTSCFSQCFSLTNILATASWKSADACRACLPSRASSS